MPRKHCTLGLSCPGKVEPVPHTDNALCMPEHVDQADCDSVVRDLPSDRDDAGPDCHIEGARVMGEALGDDFSVTASRISASGRSKTLSTSTRLTMPTSSPASSTTW